MMGNLTAEKNKKFELACVNIESLCDADRELGAIGADARGVKIMREKAVFRVVKVRDVPLRAANLLKQIFLSKAGEAAVSRGTAALAVESTDMLLMGTLAVFRAAIASMHEQPFGLRALSDELTDLLFA